MFTPSTVANADSGENDTVGRNQTPREVGLLLKNASVSTGPETVLDLPTTPYIEPSILTTNVIEEVLTNRLKTLSEFNVQVVKYRDLGDRTFLPGETANHYMIYLSDGVHACQCVTTKFDPILACANNRPMIVIKVTNYYMVFTQSKVLPVILDYEILPGIPPLKLGHPIPLIVSAKQGDIDEYNQHRPHRDMIKGFKTPNQGVLDGLESDATVGDNSKRVSPEVSGPEIARSEAEKSEAEKSEVARPEVARPEVARPEPLQPTATSTPNPVSTTTTTAKKALPQVATLTNSFVRPVIDPPVSASSFNPSSMRSAGSSSSHSPHGQIFPLSNISPYQGKWTLRVRCVKKSEVKHWTKNNNVSGRLFWANFMDDSGEIRATGFNDDVDRFYDLLVEGQVYYIHTCNVVEAKKQFSTLDNDYELIFRRDSLVEVCSDVMPEELPQIKYQFAPLEKVAEMEANQIVDIIGLIHEVHEVSTIISKGTGKSYDRRDIVLVDDTQHSIKCTLWGKDAHEFKLSPGTVYAIKGGKVNDFNGKSVSLLNSSLTASNPEIPASFKLKNWYDTVGKNTKHFSSISNSGSSGSGGNNGKNADDYDKRTTIDAVVSNPTLGHDTADNQGRGDYFTVKAMVIFIRPETISYPACSTDGCNKKVIEDSGGQWRCERCDLSFEKPNYRYILSINMGDYTGQMWMTAFDDTARIILDGIDANQMMELKDNDYDLYKSNFTKHLSKEFILRCRAKVEVFNDEPRLRVSIVTVTPVDFKSESRNLIQDINRY